MSPSGRLGNPLAPALLAALTAACIAYRPSAAEALPGAGYRVAPPPSWVSPLEAETASPPSDQLSSGVYHLLSDRQVRVVGASSEAFRHFARQIVNEAGLEDASQLSLEFEPSFQRLTLHWVRLRRGGRWLDRLAAARVQVIQRESELESQLYDGRLSAVLFLEDVRVGDVLDYAFTISGTNPIFRGRFLDSFGVDWTVPLHHMRFRLLWPGTRSLSVRNHGTNLAPTGRSLGGESELVWERWDPPPVFGEDRLPGWFDAWGWVQLSEFQSWAEVADWGRGLFSVPDRVPADLAARVEEWRRASADPAVRAVLALRFVQDEVRYMGFEMGENSHRPTSPEAVFRRRYGDCKDKALLLCALLRGLGIEAHPALVNTTAGPALDDWQPSPLGFDHAVVRVRLNGVEHWLDPTIRGQGGALGAIHFPRYARALVLEPDAEGLSRIPERRLSQPSVVARETFTTRDFDAPVELSVETEFRGADADSTRRDFLERSREEIAGSYQKFYAQTYPRVRSLAAVEYSDDRDANLVRVKERYSVPGFWSRAAEDKKRPRADVYPSAIEGVVPKQVSAERFAPMALRHPLNVRHVAEVVLPQDWDLPPENAAIDDPSVRFRFKSSYAKRHLTLEYQYETLRESVPAAEIAQYRKALESIRERLAYEVTPRVARRTAGTGGSGFGILVALALVCLVPVLLAGGALLYRQRRTRARPFGPPLGSVSDPVSDGVWRRGNQLVVRKGARLPDRCVRCGAPAGGLRLRQRYSWHHPLLYLVVFCALLIYVLVALAVRKTATLELGVCGDHLARRKRAMLGSMALALGGLSAAALPAFGGSAWCVAAGAALVLAGAVWGSVGTRMLRAVHIDDDFTTLEGAGGRYLSSLPSWGSLR